MADSFNGLDRLRAEILTGRLNRRDVLRRAMALGLSAPIIAGLLAACGEDEAEDTEPEGAAETPGGGVAQATEPAESEATEPVAATEPAEAAATEPAGAAETPQTADTGERGGDGLLRLLYWQAPVILNPHLANGTKDFHASRVVLEPLAELNNDLTGTPVLASEWPTIENGLLAEDGTSVTWKLREGVKWHDGEDFNADDVVFTYEYITNEETATTTSGPYLAISNVEKVDDYTVKVNFGAPNPGWFNTFVGAEGMILPEHVFSQYMGADARNAPPNLNPVGTGPFKVREFRPGDVILYDINMDYWDPGKPHIDEIELKGGGDATSAARAVLQSEEADWAWNLQIEPQIIEQLEATGLGEVLALPNGGTERLMINFANPREEVDGAFSEPSTQHPVFSKVEARKALALACPRDVIAEQLYGKLGVAASNQYDEPQKFTNPDVTWTYDLDQAKELISQVPEAEGFALVYQTSVNSVRQKHQEILKQEFEQLGFSVEIKSIDAAVYFSTDQGSTDTAGKFYADLEMHTNSADAYPAAWYERYRTDEIAQKENGWAKPNYFRYSNPEFDQMHDQVRIETDPDRQVELFRNMMALVTEQDVVEIPQVNRMSGAAKHNRVQGFEHRTWGSNPIVQLKDLRLQQG